MSRAGGGGTSAARVAQRRLVAQGLDVAGAAAVASTQGATVAAVAAGQLSTQAQDFAAAKWALGLRSRARQSQVDAALARGDVVRTWPMRGTLMMVARDDARWLTELLAPRSYVPSRGIWRAAGLDEGDFARSGAIARDALADGSLSRSALHAAFAAGGVDPAGSRGSLIIRRLAGDGVLVFGAPVGTTQTFALLDTWVPEARRLERDDALRELAVRYTTGHGPAGVHDLAWWSGLTLRETRRAIALAGDELESQTIDGKEYVVAVGHPETDGHPETVEGHGTVHLLPAFDEMLLGYRDRSASLDDEHRERIAPSSNGRFLPTVLFDGRVVGTWSVGSDGRIAYDWFDGASAQPLRSRAGRDALERAEAQHEVWRRG